MILHRKEVSVRETEGCSKEVETVKNGTLRLEVGNYEQLAPKAYLRSRQTSFWGKVVNH